VPTSTFGSVDREAVDSAINAVAAEFAPRVVRIRRSFGEDASGFPSVFLRIVVRDDAASPVTRLRDLARPLSIAIMNRAKTDENGLNAYFNFRTVSEQEKLRDPDWE